MGKHFALTLQLQSYVRKPGHIRTSARQVSYKKNAFSEIKSKYAGGVIFVLAILLVFFYLFQVNSFSTAGYGINRLHNKVADLENSHKKFEIQAAELQSIQRIQSDSAALSMVPVTSVDYIQATALTQR